MAYEAQKTTDEVNLMHALELTDLLGLPMVLRTTVELNIFDIIDDNNGRPISAAEIAAKLPTRNPQAAAAMLDRMLRLLASYNVVTTSSVVGEDGSGVHRRVVYGLSPIGKYFVRDDDGVSLRPRMAWQLGDAIIHSWLKLKDVTLEGGFPFNKAHGMDLFKYLGSSPSDNRLFNSAMFNHTTMCMKKIIEFYKGFENVKQLVDVGCGLGQTLNVIISHYPNIIGINFDLPHVIEHAIPHSGMKHIGGDMFTSVPNGDAIFLKWIIHDWDDKNCITLLKNCYKALPDDGKVIVCEAIVPEEAGTMSTLTAKTTSLEDVLMLTATPGGKERTENEFRKLATSSGFKSIKLACCVNNLSVMEFYK